MSIDPSDSAPVQLICAYKLDHFRVRDVWNSVHQTIKLKQFDAPAEISDKQLAINQIVAGRLLLFQQAV